METEYAIYLDVSNELADIEPASYEGAMGSNWQWPGYTRAEAEQWLAEMLAAGYHRGSLHNQRF